MKKIINGKMYDTETATAVKNDMGGEGFGRYDETLYRKKTGEYFLYGEGGPRTRYAHSAGQNAWSGGEKCIPLTYDEAREWAEHTMDADEYENEFGPVSESDDRVSVHLSLSDGDAAKLKRLAQIAGISVSAYVAQLIQEKDQ